ncbi:sensor histidine kinase [Sulfurimonas sp.]|uniref:sensor histidine kinase n=1 Tax=Sulfurimonas sp. TaxID=2022749 RepID=UPI00356873C6
MFSKSIRRNFLLQIIIASILLIFVFSSFLYFYIEKSVYDEKRNELLTYAKNISANRSVTELGSDTTDTYLKISVEVIKLKKYPTNNGLDIYETTKQKHTYLTLIYPFDIGEFSFLKITKDITPTKHLLRKILRYILIINVVGFGLVIIYAVALSKMLTKPIKSLSNKLSNMNEHLIRPVRVEELPEEFEPLGETLNHLILRIQNFVKYQKELFIGTAHEMKTPLAVIKLKNQVTLIKKRSDEEYIEAIETTNKAVDDMNFIVSNILNIGRQEGAQLEKPVEIDIIKFLRDKTNDFKLIAENEGKSIEMDFKPDGFMAMLQVGLLNQIVQNFIQNALKFTPVDKKVYIRSSQDDFGLLIEVIDEGCGIDESEDLFAPFKRQGNKSGVGLGLFLAKSAADALGAKINIKNRTDGTSGAIATLQINSKLSCIITSKR